MNNKLIITLLLIFIVTGCESQSQDQLLEKAKALYDDRDYRESVIVLKNVLVQDANNTSARLMLARSQLKLGAYDAAMKDFEQLEQKGIEESSLFPEYAQVLYRTESYSRLVGKTETEVNLTPSTLYYKALALTKLGENARAIDLIDQLVSVADDSVANLANANKLVSEQKLEEALVVLESTKFSEPLQTESFMFEAQILSALGRFSESISVLSSLEETLPFDNSIKFYLAMEYAKNNNFAEANTIAENLLQQAPNQPLLNRIKGYHLTKLGQLEDGFAHLEKAHQNGPKSDTLLMDLAQVAYQLEQNEKAYRYLALVENVRNKRVYDNLKLAISLRLGYALESIPSMFNETPNSFNADAMLKAGLQLTNKNNGKLAKQIYDNVTVNYPLNDSVELGLLGVQLGEISALSIVEKNYTDKKDANSRALYASSMIKLGEWDRAEVLANEWIAMDEDLAMGYQTLANIAIERNDEKALDMNMQKLLQIAPENLFANAYLAQKYAKNGQLDKSYELFSKLLELYPGNPNILASAYNSLKPFGKVQDIVELVSSEKRTDDIVLVPYYSTILLREQRYQDVVEMIEKFAAQPELPDSAWNNYIFSIRALGNLQAALAANKQWVQRKPNSIAAYMSLVVSFELSNQPKEALSTIKRIDEKFGRTTATALTRIYFLILDRQLELANSEFESLAKTKDVVDIPFYKGVRGRLAYFEQDYTSAVADLNDEYNNTRNEKTLKFLVSALKADNKVAEGIELLKEFLDGQPNDLITLLQLADLAHDVDSATAEDAYIQILKLRPKNLYASNNYAMLLLSQNNPQKAKALIDNVLFDNQLNPELVDTAARVYYAGGDSESGNGLFDALVQKTKGEYSTFLYIKYLTDTRQYESAEKVYNDSELTFSTRKEELNELRASW